MSAPDPVAFTIFGQDIRWYGILIAAAFVIGILMAYKRAPEYGIDSDTLLDFAITLHIPLYFGKPVFTIISALDSFFQHIPVFSVKEFAVTEDRNPIFSQYYIRLSWKLVIVLSVSISFMP